jgi:hypothetical protein
MGKRDDDDEELFRLMKPAYPGLLDLARRMPTEDLAHYVERSRKSVKRNRIALQEIERKLAMRRREVSVDYNALGTMQQKAQRELQRYEDALNIPTTVLGERRR